MKKFYIITIIFLSASLIFGQDGNSKFSSSANSQTKQMPSELSAKIDGFFKTLITKKVDIAFLELVKGSALEKKKDDITNLIQQTFKSFDIYGDLKKFEKINHQFAGSSYLRVSYIASHSTYPTRWVFTFYQSPDSGWGLTNIKFDDLTENFFKED
ncbi:MAG: hypothetical protein NT007_10425 [Candidatus Kapabacteria bacterium]|nr:hypothetical protein [Candidatus Kapabacteria bacterium]